jgi:adenine C2-methylase RlmN of 23S rRNA A2503 and tRNA A37
MAELPASIGIKRYGLPGLQALLLSWGQPAYRAKQLLAWLYQQPLPGTEGGGAAGAGEPTKDTAGGGAGTAEVPRTLAGDTAGGPSSPGVLPEQDIWKMCGYAGMSNLPASLRSRLEAEQPLARPTLLRRQLSKDGSRKYLLRLADGCCIETVGIPDHPTGASGKNAARLTTHNGTSDAAALNDAAAVAPLSAVGDRTSLSAISGGLAMVGIQPRSQGGTARDSAASGRLTVCFSTQVGCAMGCSFCATGSNGLIRSLAPGEMADQLLLVAQDFGYRVTNAVAMGEGEPFANYPALMDALRIINHPQGLGIGARHLTVSSSGLLAGIAAFANEPEQFTLAISLHSAVQSTRDRLMPGLSSQPLSALRTALLDYLDKTGRRLTLEVTLIDGVNDTPAELAALVGFAKGMLCHVNLIALNPGLAGGGAGASAGVGADAVAGASAGADTVGGAGAGAVGGAGAGSDTVAGAGAMRPSPPARCREIAAALAAAGIECSIRRSRGADIAAACGQLKGQGEGRAE